MNVSILCAFPHGAVGWPTACDFILSYFLNTGTWDYRNTCLCGTFVLSRTLVKLIQGRLLNIQKTREGNHYCKLEHVIIIATLNTSTFQKSGLPLQLGSFV